MERSLRTTLLGITSSIALLGPSAFAQQASTGRPSARVRGGTLEQIIVTAQKRSQRIQDVPIAVTAISQATLQTNRITTVEDLTGSAPNVTVRQAAGSAGLPSFTIRGITSYGVVPGSDKEASIYLDGVYIGSPYAETFTLPDIQQIEILRGPQGTLFGRNATSGAISVSTRDPNGVLGGRQDFTGGNYGQFRSRTTIDTPKFGPFSAYFSFVHNQRNGDIKNLGAGQVYERDAADKQPVFQTSPRYLGSHDSNSYFVGLKYQPSDDLKAIYKFDYAEDHYTPEGVAAIAIPPFYQGLLQELQSPYVAENFFGLSGGVNINGLVLDPSARRPDYVNNSFSTNSYERVYGHNLTTTYQVNDSIAIKDIFAYRDSFIYSNTQLDGLGGLNVGPNNPFTILGTSIESTERQISDELQVNYTSSLLTLTSGAIYYHQNSTSGAPRGYANNVAFTESLGGVVPTGNLATSDNRSSSAAVYTQAEVHITHQLDLVGGIRITHDHKGGDYTSGDFFDPTTGTFIGPQHATFVFNQTKPAYTIGVNYKLRPDILLYGKFSDSFVSGGKIGPVAFKAETAKSFETGAKADFFDHRLRVDVALFNVDYDHQQDAESGIDVGQPTLGTVIVDGGNVNAKGGELEVTAKPIDAVTLGGSVGYTDAHTTKQGPVAAFFGGNYVPTFLPKWDATMSGEYDTAPVFLGAHVVMRLDANWRSKELVQQGTQVLPGYENLIFIKNSWLANARVALVDIPVGDHTIEVAGWVRNLTNNRLPTFPLGLPFVLSTTFQDARTYGVDVDFKF